MKKISDIVEEGIRKMPFVEEAMNAGLINYSSLARLLQPFVSKELMKEATEASILMALKRRSTMGTNSLNLNPKNFRAHIGDIFVRSGLSTFTYINSSTLTENQTRLLHEIQSIPDTYCSFTQGMYERTLIISDNISDRVEHIFKNEQYLTGNKELSSATVMLKASNVRAYGLYYYIFKMIAWYGINIIEVISTSNEFSIVVESKNINDAFSVLMKIKTDDSAI
ncbi:MULTISPECIES: hypothetical protein [Reichenbachiella]|uniref:Aspartate kinase n=1 Tax=Reichenbachiella agariperforans TaxID=156994 RepID=A0A1M6RH09_REIAG|nr:MULTISPECIES: hypothetical protein [Reichenbachiella]MBU2915328.1 hypothetical protein [Reichenbachiella agariperforans]RJE70550.1 hypothetical protein BGP76_10710 [Reichenbachiella sp. MSK19-1]SHK31658.1 hypothetical protein SAMN04488028_104169 [Reichenbachiella agariperforans]